MTYLLNTFEAGTEGEAVTAADTGLSFVSTNNGASVEYDDSQAAIGTQSALIPASSGRVELRLDGLNNASIALGGWYRFASVSPATNMGVLQVRTSNGTRAFHATDWSSPGTRRGAS